MDICLYTNWHPTQLELVHPQEPFLPNKIQWLKKKRYEMFLKRVSKPEPVPKNLKECFEIETNSSI